MLHISTQLKNNIGYLLLSWKKGSQAANLFNLVNQDQTESNFSMQYVENQAHFHKNFYYFSFGLSTSIIWELSKNGF